MTVSSSAAARPVSPLARWLIASWVRMAEVSGDFSVARPSLEDVFLGLAEGEDPS